VYHYVLSVPCCAAVRYESHQPQDAWFLLVQAQSIAVDKVQPADVSTNNKIVLTN